ncbi:MAG: FG-GAP repeat domain-containing protein, partial [Deltaproteobacteria bacterium]
FVAANSLSSSNGCESCQPTVSTTGYSPLTGAGSTCGAGQVCDNGGCTAGCYIGTAFYPSLSPDPTNSCQLCEPASSTSAWTPVTGAPPTGGTCGAGQVCDTGACTAGCYIGGAFVAPGTLESGNSCQACDPGQATLAYSPVTGPAPAGGACPTGDVCDQGSCQPGCYVSGSYYQVNAASPTNSCETCQNATSTSQFEPFTGLAPSGGTCSAGQICNAGACQAGCYIASTVVAPSAQQSGDSCEQCVPASSTSGWTALTGLPPDGGTCASDQVCDNGACTNGCYIGGSFLAQGATDPNHPCRSCDDGWSNQVWSPSFTLWGGPTGAGPVAVTDWNLDGRPDVVAFSPSAGKMDVYLNSDGGALTFSDSWIDFGKDAGSMVAVADPQNGGFPNAYLPSPAQSVLQIETNNDSGGFTHCGSSFGPSTCGVLSTAPVGTASYPTLVTSGPLGANGTAALAFADQARGTIGLLSGAQFQTLTMDVATWSSSPTTEEAVALVTADFNGDGLEDLALTFNGTITFSGHPLLVSRCQVWLAQAAGGFGAPIIAGPAARGGLAAADFDLDGHIDLVGVSGLTVNVAFGDGTGNFPTLVTPNTTTADIFTGVAVGDVNGDGLPDIIATTGASVEVLLNQGGRTFSANQSFPAGPIGFVAASGWTPPASGSTYGRPTSVIATTDSNNNGFVLLNHCQ